MCDNAVMRDHPEELRIVSLSVAMHSEMTSTVRRSSTDTRPARWLKNSRSFESSWTTQLCAHNRDAWISLALVCSRSARPVDLVIGGP